MALLRVLFFLTLGRSYVLLLMINIIFADQSILGPRVGPTVALGPWSVGPAET